MYRIISYDVLYVHQKGFYLKENYRVILEVKYPFKNLVGDGFLYKIIAFFKWDTAERAIEFV